MPFPGRGYVDDVDIVAGDHLLPDVLVAAIDGRRLAGLLANDFGLRLGAIIEDIADRDDFGERRGGHGGDMRRTAIESDDADADLLSGLGGQVPDGFVASRAGSRRAHLGRGQTFKLRRIRLGFGERNRAQTEADSCDRAELQEITTVTLFKGVHGVSSRQQRTKGVATDLPAHPRQITSL